MNTAIQKELSQSGVLLIKLNRPEVLNAMNKDLIIGSNNRITRNF